MTNGARPALVLPVQQGAPAAAQAVPPAAAPSAQHAAGARRPAQHITMGTPGSRHYFELIFMSVRLGESTDSTLDQ